ncbi:MAG: hypothetical protein ABIT58_04930 [Ferruginibacter sp.]
MKKIIMISILFLNNYFLANAQKSIVRNATISNFTKPEYIEQTFLLYPVMKDSAVPKKDREYYMQKRRKNINTGWVLLGTGSGLIAAGLLIGNRKSSTLGAAEAGGIMGILGLLTALGSIPCFISASSNKHRASLSVNSRELPGNNVSKKIAVKAITLNIRLGK